jgi:hypothetical protein
LIRRPHRHPSPHSKSSRFGKEFANPNAMVIAARGVTASRQRLTESRFFLCIRSLRVNSRSAMLNRPVSVQIGSEKTALLQQAWTAADRPEIVAARSLEANNDGLLRISP